MQLTYQERFKTLAGVFDQFTNRTLFELHSRGVFEELVSPLKVGKESNVFIAVNGKKNVIVKIYRVQNCDFKRMYEYIGGDHRYQFLNKQRRQIIFAWAQREYKNLMRAAERGVTVPKPLGFMNHILVEELIGGTEPAPPVKDLPPKNPKQFFQLVIEEMKKLYKMGLVHGDLSSFNILNYQEKPYLIDFSQATLMKHPNAEELLKRDVKNIAQFFRKLGVDAPEEELYKDVTQR